MILIFGEKMREGIIIKILIVKEEDEDISNPNCFDLVTIMKTEEGLIKELN
jgi:hypothetical protein